MPLVEMAQHHIDKEMSDFAHKNISVAPNATFSVIMILLVLVSAAQDKQTVTATAGTPNEDSVFYRIDTSLRKMERQFWEQSLGFLRCKKLKLASLKCYITIDETYDSYTGRLHKKPYAECSYKEKKLRRYIHKYKPKSGDTGSFKYLVFALVYGKKHRVLRIKAIKRKECYWTYIVDTLRDLRKVIRFECALMDRGFYVAELVDKLQQVDIPFIIRARLCKEMKEIYGIYRQWEKYDYLLGDILPVKLALGRDLKNRKWGFLTNLDDVKPENLRFIYKKRWKIENIFKATDGIQLHIATPNYTLRMFSVCLSFLIYNAWQQKCKKPTLLDYIKGIFDCILHMIMSVCPYRDKLRLNNPLWCYVHIDS